MIKQRGAAVRFIRTIIGLAATGPGTVLEKHDIRSGVKRLAIVSTHRCLEVGICTAADIIPRSMSWVLGRGVVAGPFANVVGAAFVSAVTAGLKAGHWVVEAGAILVSAREGVVESVVVYARNIVITCGRPHRHRSMLIEMVKMRFAKQLFVAAS